VTIPQLVVVYPEPLLEPKVDSGFTVLFSNNDASMVI